MNPYMMNNPYLGTPVDYGQGMNMQPTFQNTGAQSAMQNAAMQEQNNQVQQAGMIGQQSGASPQQQALAMALRNQNNDPYAQAGTIGSRVDMAFNSQATPNLQNQVNKMGSNTYNPFSDYNMGRNGYGNYGE